MDMCYDKTHIQLQSECETLLKAREIIDDYTIITENSSASKIENQVDTAESNVYNPLFLLKNNLKITKETLDMIFLIKQSRAINLD